MLITPDQIRAARALKNWSQTELAERTGLAVPTIANIEAGKQSPGKNTMEKIIEAFTAADIEFTEPEGVRKRSENIKVLRGKKGFEEFYYAVYLEAMNSNDAVFLLNNINERQFDNWIPQIYDEEHLPRMIREKNTKLNIIIKEGDTYIPRIGNGKQFENIEYRWISRELFDNVSFFVFNNKLGIFLFIEKSEPIIFLMNHREAADTYRNHFLPLWQSAIKIKQKKAGK